MDSELEQKRIQLLNSSSDAVRALYGSEDLANVIDVQVTRTKLNRILIRSYVDLIGDIILGLIPRYELKTHLVNDFRFTEEEAKHIDSELEPFFARIGLNDLLPEANKEMREKLELRPQGAPKPVAMQPVINGAQPLTRDEVLKALAPSRTLHSDVASLQNVEKKTGDDGIHHGYESYVQAREGGK